MHGGGADADGFFHTGDVGELTPSGALKVVDRIKNMFKLAQGEYIAAEHLENIYVYALSETDWGLSGMSFVAQS